jgi:hypothetical protein
VTIERIGVRGRTNAPVPAAVAVTVPEKPPQIGKSGRPILKLKMLVGR